jgi:hypothetical protein
MGRSYAGGALNPGAGDGSTSFVRPCDPDHTSRAPAPDRAYDLEVSGRMGDVTALIAAPLTGGLPKPTTRPGRAALARLADGRVEFDGPLALGRKLLRLLAIDDVAVRAPKESRAERVGQAG